MKINIWTSFCFLKFHICKYSYFWLGEARRETLENSDCNDCKGLNTEESGDLHPLLFFFFFVKNTKKKTWYFSSGGFSTLARRAVNTWNNNTEKDPTVIRVFKNKSTSHSPEPLWIIPARLTAHQWYCRALAALQLSICIRLFQSLTY